MNNKTVSIHESQPYVFLHEDAFETYFEPYRDPNTTANVWNDLGLSAYGKDWETLKEVSPNYVWMVIESEGDRWITPGFHVVKTRVLPHYEKTTYVFTVRVQVCVASDFSHTTGFAASNE